MQAAVSSLKIDAHVSTAKDEAAMRARGKLETEISALLVHYQELVHYLNLNYNDLDSCSSIHIR